MHILASKFNFFFSLCYYWAGSILTTVCYHKFFEISLMTLEILKSDKWWNSDKIKTDRKLYLQDCSGKTGGSDLRILYNLKI